ncbi:MAG: hypothetical protein ACPGUV_09720 [Polyangiales bacterium]
MEVHRQRCQACQSIDLRNIIAREAGSPDTIYVRCARCQALVARYRLSGYYHHGKGLDSFLRSQGSRSRESGRGLLKDFERAREESLQGYDEVLHVLTDTQREV